MPRPTFSSALLAVIGVLAATGVQAAEHSASILSGGDDINPIVVNPSKPIVLIVVQLALIIALSRILHFFLSYARQPRVVSEILAGILLGPTAFGQIPGFTSNIFPQASITYLTLLSEVGLVLFLAVVGMESDMGLLERNLKPALAVSIAGLALPFAIGCGVAYGLYRQFGAEDVKFTTFMTFIGTSSSITALPVLARILGEIGLMQDRVGLVALAAGVVNDCIGWALLALSIALANAGKGVVVVYILLTLVGWMLFLLYACRPALQWFARYTGSYGPHGPTQNFVCATLLLVFVSAFFCECIGISSIFGGFLVGLIIPAHFCHSLTAKIEDLVACILVPLYFATSGLSTNLTLLNSGIIWAWTVCVIVCAFIGKFAGCALAARFTGFNWRESGATGSLMAAKGLIELIVLNQGLTAGIISETVFSIFVLEALLLTIASTPLALAFYPARVRNTAKHASASSTSSGSLGDQKRPLGGGSTSPTAGTGAALPFKPRTRFTVVLDQLDSLGAAMVFTHLFAGSASSPPSSAMSTTASAPMSKDGTDATLAPAGAVEQEAGDVGLTTATEEARATAGEGTGGTNTVQEAPLLASAGAIKPAASGGGGAGGLVSLIPLRLVELTDRTSSSLLAAASPAQLLHSDALTALFRTFASLFPSSLSSPFSSPLAAPTVQVDMHCAAFEVEQQERWAEVVARKAAEEGSEGVVVGWKIGGGGGMAIGLGGAGVMDVTGEGKHVGMGEGSILPNPFSHLFPTSQPASPAADPSSSSSRPHLPRAPSSSSVSPHPVAAEITHGTAPRFAAFLRALFLEASCDVSVLIDRSGASSFPHHQNAPATARGGTTLFVPFFGGADDRAALELAAQIVLRSVGVVRARVVVIERAAEETDEDRAALGAGTGGAEARLSEEEESTPEEEGEEKLGRHHLGLDGQHGLTTGSQTHYPTAAGGRTLATAAGGGGGGGGGGLASETADSVLVAQIEALSRPSVEGGAALLPPGALVVERVQTAHPLRTMLRRLSSLPNSGSEGGQGKTLTLLGRSRRDAPSHLAESRALLLAAQKAGRLAGSVVQSEQVRRAVGEAASQVLLGLGSEGEGEGGGGWVWVVQSRWTAGRRGVRRRVGEEA
ncbi:hypothetical protein JCM8097_006688 [Rhodosporidiobolus ruineniae]